jgi:hypothetical protein
MKIRPKGFFQKASTDLKKGVSLKESMHKQSEDIARIEAHPKKENNTKVTINVAGNLRGMHNAANPPSSEVMARNRSMRKLWNKRMPTLNCSNCQFSAQCTQFRAGYECAFLPFLNSHRIDTEEDLLFYAKEFLTLGIQRAQQTVIMERLSGAVPSLETTESLAYMFNQLMQLYTTMQKANQVSLTVESSDAGIITRLFGDLSSLVGNTKAAKEKEIDAPFFSRDTAIDVPALPEKSSVDDELVKELAMLRDDKTQPVPVSAVKEESKPQVETLQ